MWKKPDNQKRQIRRDRKAIRGCQGCGEGMGVTVNGHRVSSGGDGNVPELMQMATELYILKG